MLDEAQRRSDFPSLEEMTYLNTAAEGIPPRMVADAFQAYSRDRLQGSAGREAHMVEWRRVRELTAGFYGLAADDIGICSCTSEAFNLLALGLQLRPGDEVVINDLDFPAARTPFLQEACPATVRLWRSRDGALRAEDLGALLGPRTRLVSASLVSYFNGYRLDVPAVLETIRRHSSALFALDVTQALGRVPLELADVDFIVSSTHKWICATHGGGLVGISPARAAELTPPAGGWFNLEDPFGPGAEGRAVSKPGAAGYMVGMPNFPAIYAIRAALEYLGAIGVERIEHAARPLVWACLEGLARLPVDLLTPRDGAALAGIVSFRHPEMERIQAALQADRIHVMHSSGRMRVSIHGYNTAEDVERFLRRLAELV